MKQENELLNCPFCGSQPVVDDSCADITIMCGGECGAQPRYIPLHEDGTRRQATKAWNTRALSTKPADHVVDTDKMVEAVAMAIAAADFDESEIYILAFEDSGLFVAQNWSHYIPKAKAAIAAIEKIRQ